MAALFSLSRTHFCKFHQQAIPTSTILTKKCHRSSKLDFEPSTVLSSKIPFSRVAGVRASSVQVGSSQSGAAMAGSDGEEVVAGVIVGAGRVGQALEKMGGGRDVVVRRGEKVPEESAGPIFVCTRNDVLDSVVDATPPSRRAGNHPPHIEFVLQITFQPLFLRKHSPRCTAC